MSYNNSSNYWIKFFFTWLKIEVINKYYSTISSIHKSNIEILFFDGYSWILKEATTLQINNLVIKTCSITNQYILYYPNGEKIVFQDFKKNATVYTSDTVNKNEILIYLTAWPLRVEDLQIIEMTLS